MTRKWAVFSFGVFALGALALLDCVGDEPATGGSDAQAGSDASTNDTGTNPNGDGGDAAAPDPCAGEAAGCAGDVQPTHLKLWLRSDTGVDCVGGHVMAWHDLSGNGHDAIPPVFDDGGPAAAPQCGIASMNGHAAISFTRPNAPGPTFVDETIQVDISAMGSGSYMAILVLQPDYSAETGILSAQLSAHGQILCGPDKTYNDQRLDFDFGGFPDGGSVSITYDREVACPFFSKGFYPPHPAMFETFSFDVSSGHVLKINGVPVLTGDAGAQDLLPAADVGLRPGVLGRASNPGVDTRYKGLVAEVIVYDTILAGLEEDGLNAYVGNRYGALN